MQLISKLNKGMWFLLYVICVFSKYAFVVSLKDKRVPQLPMLFKRLNQKNMGQ